MRGEVEEVINLNLILKVLDLPKRNENICSCEDLYANFLAGVLAPQLEVIQMSINWRIHKQNMVHPLGTTEHKK